MLINKYVSENRFDDAAGLRLNRIDKQVTEIMLRSEDKLYPDNTPYAYSADLDRQMSIVRLIKALEKKQNQTYPVEAYVNTDLQDVAAEILHLPVEQLPELLDQERQKLEDMQDVAWDIRDASNQKIQNKMAEEKTNRH